MSTISITYPYENCVLYGDTLNLKYKLNLVSADNAKFMVLSLNGYETIIDLKQYTKTYQLVGLNSGDNNISGYITTQSGKKISQSDFNINFKTVTEKFVPPNLNWISIRNNLPDFIKEDYKTFTKFVEAYYEWLQTSNNPLYSVFNSETFPDVDRTPEIFLEKFRTQYLNDFPLSILENKEVNIRNVIKNIKQFYQSKGTEKSFKFLFRLLFNTYIELYYPKKDLLIASGDLWVENTIIRIRGITWNEANKLKKSIIYQKKYNDDLKKYEIISSARIVDIDSYRIGKEEIFELTVDNIVGEFDIYSPEQSLTDYLQGYIGESVYVDVIDGKTVTPFQVYLINGISEITVSNPGLKSGEYIEVHPVSPSMGSLFSAVVRNVDSNGYPTEFVILNHGYDYRGAETNFKIYRKNPDNSLDELFGSIKIKKLFKESGYYRTKKSFPSSDGKIRDNRKYQESSYVIRSTFKPEEYMDVIKKLVHPAGVGVFHDFLVYNTDDALINSSSIVNKYVRPYIGNYLPYTLLTFKNLRDDVYVYGLSNLYPDGLKDLYPSGFDSQQIQPDQITATTSHLPEYSNIIKDKVKYTKFTYLPLVSDITKINEYWVVFPHPNTTKGILNTDKRLMDLTIREFTTLFTETVQI